MASSDSVKVALRIRPQNVREQVAKHKICTSVSKLGTQVSVNDKSFSYNYVFDRDTTQADVYKTCIENLIESVFNGLNATVLAYGQTGSGKSYTMGTESASVQSEVVGIIPRAVSQLFQMIDSLKKQAIERNEDEPRFTVEVQFIELYNEDLIDLLATDRNTNVKIHEEADSGQIVIKNAKKNQADTAEKVLNILKFGTLNRTTGSTNMNKQSSRSHAIFSMYVRQEKYEAAENEEKVLTKLTSKLHFVDLAGSERLKRTGAVGDRAKEGISINCGLLALGNVICALTDPKKMHVPYRDSKLTRLLQDSLGGNSQTLMIACVSPCDVDCTETLNTMTYASRAKGIQNRIVINRDYETKQISQLKAEISRLQNELRSQSGLKTNVEPLADANKNEEKPLTLIEQFKKSSEDVLNEFKTRVDSALGNKPEIDSLVSSREELLELTEKFRGGLEESLYVLSIPSRAKTRRMRRDTIFDRYGGNRKRVTTLISVPNNLNGIQDDEPDENAMNVDQPESDDRLKQELEEAKLRISQLEDECRSVRDKSSATVAHLTKAMFDLKQEMADSLKQKNITKI